MNETMPAERSYIAFISYRHTPLDREAAERVQKKIESYVVPKEFREQAGGRKLGMCFRDEDELPASSSLTDSIYYALDHSKFLIVICTPNLPLSKWCEAEIKYFLKTHDRDHLLAVLADGTSDVSFSPYMLHDFDEEGNISKDWEPLAANIAGENHTINNKAFKKEIVRLYAAMIGCPFDALWQRERRARTNRIITAGVGVIAVLAVFLGVVMNRNAQISAQNEQIKAANEQIQNQNNELLEKNDEIQKQNDQITKQNEEIEEKNTKLQSQLSSALVDSGLNKLEKYDIKGALKDGLAALESDNPAVYDHRAENLLADALGAYEYFDLRTEAVYEQSTRIAEMAKSADDKLLYLADEGGTIRCLDTENFTVQWESLMPDSYLQLHTTGLTDRLLVKLADSVICLSTEDGSTLWTYDYFKPNWFRCLSDDGSILAVLDANPDRDMKVSANEDFLPVYAIFLDTKTGEVLGQCEVSTKDYQIKYLFTSVPSAQYCADFTSDNAFFALAFVAQATKDDAKDPEAMPGFIIDLNTFEASYFGSKVTGGYFQKLGVNFGMDLADDAGTLFWAQYNGTSLELETATIQKTDDAYDWDFQYTKVVYGTSTGVDSYYDDGVADLHYSAPSILSSDLHELVFLDSMILIFDKEPARLRRRFQFDAPILAAHWVHEEDEVVEMILKNGSVIQYDIGTDKVLDDYGNIALDQQNLSAACSLSGGIWADFQKGAYLSISNDLPGTLLLSRYTSDPHAEFLIDTTNVSILDLPADSSYGLLRFSGYGTQDILLFDKKQYTEIKRASFESASSRHAYLLDEEHFLQDAMLFSFDGTGEYLKGGERIGRSIRLSDGRILSFTSSNLEHEDLGFDTENGKASYFYPMLWLDQTPLPSLGDPKDGLIYTYAENPGDSFGYEGWYGNFSACPGENGLVVFFGKDAEMKNKVLSAVETPRFSIYDVYTGSITRMENTFPDYQQFTFAVGSKDPIFAAAYENGQVCIYDVSAGSYTLLPASYGPNELLAVSFALDDSILLAMTTVGRLDVYDTDTFTLLFSEIIPSVNESIQYDQMIARLSNRSSFVIFNSLDSVYDADSNMLLIIVKDDTVSNSSLPCILLDTASWTLRKSLKNVTAFDSDDEKLYIPTYHYQYAKESPAVLAFPLYSLNDLKAWAREVIENG